MLRRETIASRTMLASSSGAMASAWQVMSPGKARSVVRVHVLRFQSEALDLLGRHGDAREIDRVAVLASRRRSRLRPAL